MIRWNTKIQTIMDPFQKTKISQSVDKNKEISEWFPEPSHYINENAKSSHPNIYLINNNASVQDQDSITQTTSSLAANSLQNFVEEALRSVEDGVASLDHRALNIMVERQKETAAIMTPSGSITNQSYPQHHSMAYSSNIEQSLPFEQNTLANSSSSGLDLAQVVSEIFNDNIETLESDNVMTKREITQKLFNSFDDRGSDDIKCGDLSSTTADGTLSTGHDACLQPSIISLSELPSSSDLASNPSRLVVSPSVLSKVLSDNYCASPLNTYAGNKQHLELGGDSQAVIIRRNLEAEKFLNLHCDKSDSGIFQQTSVRCLHPSSRQCYPNVPNKSNFDLSNTQSHHSSTSSLAFVERFKLPQQPLPRSSLLEFKENATALPRTKNVSPQNIVPQSENATTGHVQQRNYSTSNLAHNHPGNVYRFC